MLIDHDRPGDETEDNKADRYRLSHKGGGEERFEETGESEYWGDHNYGAGLI